MGAYFFHAGEGYLGEERGCAPAPFSGEGCRGYRGGTVDAVIWPERPEEGVHQWGEEWPYRLLQNI